MKYVNILFLSSILCFVKIGNQSEVCASTHSGHTEPSLPTMQMGTPRSLPISKRQTVGSQIVTLIVIKIIHDQVNSVGTFYFSNLVRLLIILLGNP